MSALKVSVQIESPHALRQMRESPRVVQDSLKRQALALDGEPFKGTFIVMARVPRRALAIWQTRIGAIPNLYKLDLPQGWRALYFVASNEERRDVFVIEVVSHKEYERLLGYG